MSQNNTKETAGRSSAEPAPGGAKPLGDSGSGAAGHGQGDGGADESSASGDSQTDPDNSTLSDNDDSDDGDSFIKALASGKLDDVDEDGSTDSVDDDSESETDDVEETEDDDTETAESEDEAKAETEEDEAKDPAAEEAKKTEHEADLTDEEKKAIEEAPRNQRKGMRSLFKERKHLRAELEQHKASVEQLTPAKQFADAFIQDAESAGLVDMVTGEDGTKRRDFTKLRQVLEQERFLSSKSPAEVAAYYRQLADEVYPEGRPVTLPDDLREMVELGMKPEEAEIIARKREEAKRGPIEQERKKREAEAKQRAEAERAESKKKHDQEVEAGYREMNEVAQPYAKKFGAEWKQIGEEVSEKLQTLLPDVSPSGWRKIAKEVIEATIAKRRAVPLKRPTRTPPPGRGSSRSSDGDDDVSSEEDDVRALASGKF